jgi:hypothetical protein
MEWEEFKKESTEDLIQYIKWKNEPDYEKMLQKLHFTLFVFVLAMML